MRAKSTASLGGANSSSAMSAAGPASIMQSGGREARISTGRSLISEVRETSARRHYRDSCRGGRLFSIGDAARSRSRSCACAHSHGGRHDARTATPADGTCAQRSTRDGRRGRPRRGTRRAHSLRGPRRSESAPGSRSLRRERDE